MAIDIAALEQLDVSEACPFCGRELLVWKDINTGANFMRCTPCGGNWSFDATKGKYIGRIAS